MPLPTIDFDAHPAYRGLEPRIEQRTELREAWDREFEHALNTWKDYEDFWHYPSETSMGGASDVYQKLYQDGAVGICLTERTLNWLELACSAYFKRMRDALSAEPLDRSSGSRIRLSMAEFQSQGDVKLRDAIMALLEETGLVTLTGKYLGVSEVQLSYIHFKITDNLTSIESGTREVFSDLAWPDPPTSYLHVDTTPFHLKTIIYLSEVRDLSDGPFQYILGSNHSSRANFKDYVTRLATQHYASSRNKEGRVKLMGLTPELRQRLDFGSDLLDATSTSGDLLKREHTFHSPEANAIVFDPLGVHRGGRVVTGEREILQLTLSGVLPDGAAKSAS